MNIDKYINWNELWDEEIDLSIAKDWCKEDSEPARLISSFLEETEMELLQSECQINNGNFVFFFSESGGQNESDTQGWSRDYTFTFDEEFNFIDVEYSQG